MDKKTKVAVRGTSAAASYRASVLVLSFEVTSKEAKQIKAGAILYLAQERARALCDDGICMMAEETKSEPTVTRIDNKKEIDHG